MRSIFISFHRYLWVGFYCHRGSSRLRFRSLVFGSVLTEHSTLKNEHTTIEAYFFWTFYNKKWTNYNAVVGFVLTKNRTFIVNHILCTVQILVYYVQILCVYYALFTFHCTMFKSVRAYYTLFTFHCTVFKILLELFSFKKILFL